MLFRSGNTVINGDFALSDPAAAGFGWSLLGGAEATGGQGVLTENSNLASRFLQTVTKPDGAVALTFTILDASFDAPGTGPQDAFEVALLDPATLTPLVGGIALSNTDAALNIQADGTVYGAAGVVVDGLVNNQLPEIGRAHV